MWLVAVLLLAAADEEPVGDPSAGRALYTGAQSFEKGGPACGACHALGGQGLALDASFGPDLSFSKAALDLDVLDGVMSDQPYRSMKPLYAKKPISAQERAHVAAFIRVAAGKEAASGGGWIFAQASAIALALGAALAWARRRVVSPREQLQRNRRTP